MIALSSRVLEKGRRPAGTRFDVAGMLTFALGAGTLTYGLTAGQRDRGAALVVSALAPAALGFAEFRGRTPLLDVRLFARASLSAVMACALASTAAFAALVYTSVWLQSGLALMPLAPASFVTSPAGGRWLRGRSPRALLAGGLLLSGIGCAPRSLPGANASAGTRGGAGRHRRRPGRAGDGRGGVAAPRSGMAAGAMTTFRRLGQTRGVAVFGVLFQRPGGLHRVMIAAAVIGAALARAFVPKRVAERTAVPPARDLTGPGAQR